MSGQPPGSRTPLQRKPTHLFRFHAPDGFETDYFGLTNYFKAIREAFENRSIRRGIIVVDGNFAACQTWIEGTFVREFTQSPAGTLPPNDQRQSGTC